MAIALGSILALTASSGVAQLTPRRAFAQDPTATPAGSATSEIVGPLPRCAVELLTHASPQEVEVGTRVTAALDVRVECPRQLAGAAVLIVVGGVRPEAVPGVRTALGVLVDAVRNEPDARLAVLHDGETADTVRFAAGADREAVADEVRHIEARGTDEILAWFTRLRAAAGALEAASTLSTRPVLVVVQAAALPGPFGNYRMALDEAAGRVNERVGTTIVLDASLSGWLRSNISSALPPSTLAVLDRSTSGLLLPSGAAHIATTMNAPIADLRLAVGPGTSIALDLSSAEPRGADRGSDAWVHWTLVPTAPRATTVHARVAGDAVAAQREGALLASASVTRDGPLAMQVMDHGIVSFGVCTYASDTGPAPCRITPSPTPTPMPVPSATPTPTLAPLANAIYLPYGRSPRPEP